MADIYFRVDGNSIISTGHIMRCLSIARACRKIMNGKGFPGEIRFLVSDRESEALLRERMSGNGNPTAENKSRNFSATRDVEETFEIINLNCRYDCLDEDIAGYGIVETLGEKPWIFVDSYFAGPEYFESMRRFFRVAYLDDLREFPCDVELLINYDTDEDCDFYKCAAMKLLGPEYTPLREQFEGTLYKVKKEVTDVLLSTGGTDPYGVAEKILERMGVAGCEVGAGCNVAAGGEVVAECETGAGCEVGAECEVAAGCEVGAECEVASGWNYHVVTSRANRRFDALITLAEKNPRIFVHEGVTDMASLMASCDIAVSAGGVTLCELAAVGVPTISFSMADNQMTAVENFAKRDLIPYCGDVRGEADECEDVCGEADEREDVCGEADEREDEAFEEAIDKVVSKLQEIAKDYSLRQEKSMMLRDYIDGCGAAKIAEKLLL